MRLEVVDRELQGSDDGRARAADRARQPRSRRAAASSRRARATAAARGARAAPSSAACCAGHTGVGPGREWSPPWEYRLRARRRPRRRCAIRRGRASRPRRSRRTRRERRRCLEPGARRTLPSACEIDPAVVERGRGKAPDPAQPDRHRVASTSGFATESGTPPSSTVTTRLRRQGSSMSATALTLNPGNVGRERRRSAGRAAASPTGGSSAKTSRPAARSRPSVSAALKCGLVDHSAPGGVHENGLGTHPSELARADQHLRGVVQRHVHGDHVRPAEQLVERRPPRHRRRCAARRRRRAPCSRSPAAAWRRRGRSRRAR